MAILGLFGRKKHERAGFSLYTEAVRAGRSPYFYVSLGVPDTLDGRFDLIGVHVLLLIDRLRAEVSPGPELAQAVFDAMFSDMDGILREMGVSDMALARRVKAMWEALNGRNQAYTAPLEAGDLASLAAALARNVWRGAPTGDGPAALAAYMLRQRDALAGQPLTALRAGKVGFVGPEAVAA